MTNEQLESKFMDLTSGVISNDQANSLIQKCYDLASMKDVRDLIELSIPETS